MYITLFFCRQCRHHNPSELQINNIGCVIHTNGKSIFFNKECFFTFIHTQPTIITNAVYTSIHPCKPSYYIEDVNIFFKT